MGKDFFIRVCNGSFDHCDCDFSVINNTNYEQLFEALPNAIYKQLSSITFSCVYQREYEKSKEKNGNVSKKIENILFASIANMKKGFLPYLVKCLKKALPKSKYLKKLKVSSMKMDKKYFEILVDSICNSDSLEELEFSNIVTDAESYIYLMKNLSRYRIRSLVFKKCKMGSAVFPSIIGFLSKENLRLKPKIQYLVFQQCGFLEKELSQIDVLLHGDPPIEENGEINQKTVKEQIMDALIEESYYESDDSKIPSPVDNQNMKKTQGFFDKNGIYDSLDEINSESYKTGSKSQKEQLDSKENGALRSKPKNSIPNVSKIFTNNLQLPTKVDDYDYYVEEEYEEDNCENLTDLKKDQNSTSTIVMCDSKNVKIPTLENQNHKIDNDIEEEEKVDVIDNNGTKAVPSIQSLPQSIINDIDYDIEEEEEKVDVMDKVKTKAVPSIQSLPQSIINDIDYDIEEEENLDVIDNVETKSLQTVQSTLPANINDIEEEEEEEQIIQTDDLGNRIA